MKAALLEIAARIIAGFQLTDEKQVEDIIVACDREIRRVIVEEFGGWNFATTKESGITYCLPKNPEAFLSQIPEAQQPDLKFLITAPQFELNCNWYSLTAARGPTDDLWRINIEDLAVFAKKYQEYHQVFDECDHCHLGHCEIHGDYVLQKFDKYSINPAELMDSSNWFDRVLHAMDSFLMT